MMKVRTLQSTPIDERVLIHAVDHNYRRVLAEMISTFGCQVESTGEFPMTLHALRHAPIDICVVDNGDKFDGEMIAQLRETNRTVQFIFLVEEDSTAVNNIIPAISCDYIAKPVSEARLESVLVATSEKAKLITENRRLRQQLSQQLGSELIGMSEAMTVLRDQVNEVARGDHPVLISGEAGTETTAIAQAVHASSRRSHRPVAKIDCRLLTSENLERELFGEVVGDDDLSVGRLEWAIGGTLLLEHIDQSSLRVNDTLLTIMKSSADKQESVRSQSLTSVRIIATARCDIAEQVASGRLRSELYQMLAATTLVVPPLRERRNDLGLLAEAILNHLAIENGTPVKRLSLNALQLLKIHDWPGNFAELQTVLQKVCACDSQLKITAETIQPWLATQLPEQSTETPWLSLKEMERRLIETTFARCAGNRERTAQALKIGIRTLSGKLREYGYPPRGGPGSNREQSPKRVA